MVKISNNLNDVKNFEKIELYYPKGCTDTQNITCVDLGKLYLKGYGVAKDLKKAIRQKNLH